VPPLAPLATPLNPASAEEQNLKFLVKVVNKTAASGAQLAKRILLHVYSRKIASFQLREKNKNFIQL